MYTILIRSLNKNFIRNYKSGSFHVKGHSHPKYPSVTDGWETVGIRQDILMKTINFILGFYMLDGNGACQGLYCVCK